MSNVEFDEPAGLGAGTADAANSQPEIARSMPGAVIGVLIGFQHGGKTPLVIFPGQPSGAAVPAGTARILAGSDLGREVVLVFEGADARRPIVVGLMERESRSQPAAATGQTELEADGENLVVTAGRQLVLRCGKASITLTKAGKVLIQGAYVSNRSSGVLRLKGGSVQIN
jgi:hypothetical protein